MSEQGIPADILNDLSSRFIINIPEEEKNNHIRICFQIELAYWFYLDFYCTDQDRKLKYCSMKEFTSQIYEHIPVLRPHVSSVDYILEQWREYKQSVPTYGAIVLNEDLTKVLLVQSYLARCSWGFPKGKVNKDENPSHCAVREVLEETGFDISKLIDDNEYIESVINYQLIRLYIISGVQKNTKFQPKTRKEIKHVDWFDLENLPNNKKDMTPKFKIGVGPNAFFMVVPFIKRIKRWVQEKLQKESRSASTGQIKRYHHKSVADVESNFKNKKQLLPRNEIVDCKGSRQAMTSPTLQRSKMPELEKGLSKVTIKRNLFGELQGEQSSPVLAKNLAESPVVKKTNSKTILKDPLNITPKKTENLNKSSIIKEKKGKK